MRNLRNFGITFAISLVVLGIVAIFAAKYVAGAVTDIFNTEDKDLDNILITPVETSGEEGEQEDKFSKELEGETFTWLMVVYDKRTSVYNDYYPTSSKLEKVEGAGEGLLGKDYRLVEAKAFAVVHANVVTRDYIIMTIPTITKVETVTGDYTLGELYGVYGIDYICEKVGTMIGLDIDYYTVMNAIDLPSLATSIGAVTCELPLPIGYDGKEYVTFRDPEEETSGEDTTGEETDEETTDDPAPAEETKPEETTDPADTTNKADTTEKEPEETKPEVVIKNELDASEAVKLSKKLGVALLYSDYSDGIDQEMTILTSFVNGVLTNISKSSDNALQNMIIGLESKMKTNIQSADIAKNGDVIRAYTWMGKQTYVYPGRFVSASANKEAFYMPDTNKAMEIFYNFR
ncbi:MAG: hypothetical protein IKL36_02735 [Clostridia bacterium]|nr:hypothetical protein [Clostridia bacterium]